MTSMDSKYILVLMSALFFFMTPCASSTCTREKNGITFTANKNCELVNTKKESEEEIIYFVHLYPDFMCTSQFPIQFFFTGVNFPVDGIYVEMDYTDGLYQVSVDMFGFSPEYVGRYGCQSRLNHSIENSYYVLFDLEKRRGLILGNGETLRIEADKEIVTLPCLLPVLSPRVVLLKDMGYDRNRHCSSAFINNTINKLGLAKTTCTNLDGLDEIAEENYHMKQAQKLATHQFLQMELDSSLVYKVSVGFLLNTTALVNPWGKYICAVDLERNYIKLVLTRKEYVIHPKTWNSRYPQVKQPLFKDLNLSCMAREPIHHELKTEDGFHVPQVNIVYSNSTTEFKYAIHFTISREKWGYRFILSCVYNKSHKIISPVIVQWNIHRTDLDEVLVTDLGFRVTDSGRLGCVSGIKSLAEVEVIYCANPVECLAMSEDAFQIRVKKYPDGRKRSKNYRYNDDVSKYPSGEISCSDDFEIVHATFAHGFNDEIYLIPGDVDIYSPYEVLIQSTKMFLANPKNSDDSKGSNETKSKWDHLQYLNTNRLKAGLRNTPSSPFLLLDSFTTFVKDPTKFSIRCRSKSFLFEETFTWAMLFKNNTLKILSASENSDFEFEVEASESKVQIAALAGAPVNKENLNESPNDQHGYGNLASEHTEYGETTTGFEEVVTIRMNDISQLSAVTCGAKYRYFTSQSVMVVQKVELRNPEPAVILTNHTTYEFKVNDETKYLSCLTTGWPKPVVHWYRNDTIVSSAFLRGDSELILRFSRVTKEDAGNYICTTENGFGRTSKTFTVLVTEPENSFLQRTILILAGVCILIVLLAGVIILKKFRNKITKTHKLTQQDVEALLGESNDQMIPYSKDYEIPLELLEFDKRVLGKGAYGMVMKGYLKNTSIDTETTVAIKSVKSEKETELMYLKALVSELKIMLYTGKHKNVIRLYGANTTNISEGKLYVVVEYCENGNLENFLRTYRSSFITTAKEDKPVPNDTVTSTQCYQNVDVSETVNEGKPSPHQAVMNRYENFAARNAITLADLMKWSYEIANGMEYLGTKKIIHGDLAARNVLLTRNMVVKITDFGLAKQLYEYTHYIRKTKLLLPWRQMALESLKDMCFSVQSDVWSFGVTLWEIYTLSQVPFAGIAYDDDFLKRLENGLRLGRPAHAPEEIYTLMSNCWNSDPAKRPSFACLKTALEEMAPSSPPTDETNATGSIQGEVSRISLKGQDQQYDQEDYNFN